MFGMREKLRSSTVKESCVHIEATRVNVFERIRGDAWYLTSNLLVTVESRLTVNLSHA